MHRNIHCQSVAHLVNTVFLIILYLNGELLINNDEDKKPTFECRMEYDIL